MGFNGSINNDGGIVENNLKSLLFKDFKLVLSGHYHNAHKAGSNIYHLPSIYQHDFSEDSNKGWTILYDDWSMELVKSEFKQYKTYDINLDDSKFTKKALNNLIKDCSGDDSYIRFKISGSEAKINAFKKDSIVAMGIKVETDIKCPVGAKNESDVNIQKYTDDSILEAFKKFCKQEDLVYEEGVKYLK
jgi:hypothetical protein